MCRQWSTCSTHHLEKGWNHPGRKQPQVSISDHFMEVNTFLVHNTHICHPVRYRFGVDGSLHILSAQVTDTGRYLCMATNQAGTERKRVDLQVYGEYANTVQPCLLNYTAIAFSIRKILRVEFNGKRTFIFKELIRTVLNVLFI